METAAAGGPRFAAPEVAEIFTKILAVNSGLKCAT
jgi:hypothetical protein